VRKSFPERAAMANAEKISIRNHSQSAAGEVSKKAYRKGDKGVKKS